jgi:hypothetical protein
MPRNPDLTPWKRFTLDIKRVTSMPKKAEAAPQSPKVESRESSHKAENFRFRAGVGIELSGGNSGIQARLSLELQQVQEDARYMEALNVDAIDVRTALKGIPTTHPNFGVARMYVEKYPNISPERLQQMFNIENPPHLKSGEEKKV